MGKYKTALEAAWAFVLCAVRFAGIKEGGKEHKELIGAYNTIDPLPYGYTMTVKDAWCAAFLSAIAKMLGYERFPFECSCSRMLAQARTMGLDTWGRGHEPRIGDLLIYDLDCNGKIDHIGVVVWVEGSYAWIVEGNYSNAVKLRKIRIDDPMVYAWICPDWMELVDNSNWVGADRPNIPIEIPELKEDENMEKIYKTVDEMPDWAKAEMKALEESGAMKGRGGEEGLDLTESEVRLLTIMERRISGMAGK